VSPSVPPSQEWRSAVVEFEALQSSFLSGFPCGLVHGRMSPAEKEEAMAKFKSGETRALVSTTVVEVGIDIPEATVMVVEHAERYGTAQLHQLRGRVGRGTRPATCILLTSR
jgi:ATP-dependent DNA helicase RecG